MQLAVPYGDAGETVTIPDERLLGVLTAESAPAGDEAALLRHSVAAPVSGGEALDAFVGPGESLLVLVNDATRPTPTARMLETLWDTISAADLGFLVATGTHRPPTDAELEHIFGRRWPALRSRVAVHDARDQGQLTRTGRTSLGNDILLNRRVAQANRILVLSSVETHYFAGYTGGRKIILPGVAGFATIERNHRLAMESGTCSLALDGNPVHQEMEEALATVSADIFAVLTVLDRDHRIHAACSGDIGEAFRAATAAVDRLYSVPAPGSADIVIAVATHPLDLDFYQAQKAIENGKLILRDGGILILVSACRDGIGNDAFMGIMIEAGSPGRVAELARSGYRLGYHKAARLAELAERAEMWAVVGVGDDVARAAFMRPFATVQQALDEALETRPGAEIIVLMDAGTTVPRQS
ncbi:MAG: nickel-dependent lactate racemase family protein [Thermoleophilia bacterium]